jgi:hypothetical protein
VKPTPHRFRHTFARILLQKPGVTVRDVAELLGNTEEMIRKHYGAWVPEVAAKLRRGVRLVPDAEPHERQARFLQPCRVLPCAGHHDPAPGLRDGIAAEFDELLFASGCRSRSAKHPATSRIVLPCGFLRCRAGR